MGGGQEASLLIAGVKKKKKKGAAWIRMILDKFKSFYFPNAMFFSLSLSFSPPFLPQKNKLIFFQWPPFSFLLFGWQKPKWLLLYWNLCKMIIKLFWRECWLLILFLDQKEKDSWHGLSLDDVLLVFYWIHLSNSLWIPPLLLFWSSLVLLVWLWNICMNSIPLLLVIINNNQVLHISMMD